MSAAGRQPFELRCEDSCPQLDAQQLGSAAQLLNFPFFTRGLWHPRSREQPWRFPFLQATTLSMLISMNFVALSWFSGGSSGGSSSGGSSGFGSEQQHCDGEVSAEEEEEVFAYVSAVSVSDNPCMNSGWKIRPSAKIVPARDKNESESESDSVSGLEPPFAVIRTLLPGSTGPCRPWPCVGPDPPSPGSPGPHSKNQKQLAARRRQLIAT